MANTAKKKTTKAAAAKNTTATAAKKKTTAKKAVASATAKKAPAKKTAAKAATKNAEPAKKTATKKAAPKAAAKTAAKPVAKKAPMKKAALGTSAKAAPVKKTAVKTVSESKSAMGRGLGALLSSDGIPENKRDSVVELKLNDISPNDGQPRKNFDEEKINSLASSIEENGIIQPIIVQKKGDGYRIVAGERRWRAARIAGLSVIPAIVRDLTDRQTMEQALIENIQREDLNPIEEAMAIQNLLKTHKLTQDQLAKKLGKGRSSITNTLRILELDESLQEFVSRGDLSEGHAKVILAVKDKEDQRKVADYIMTRDLNVRQAEVFVKKFLDAQNAPDKKKVIESPDIRFALSIKEVETKFKKALGAKTKIKILDSASGRGRIVIDYKDYEDLDKLTELLCGQ